MYTYIWTIKFFHVLVLYIVQAISTFTVRFSCNLMTASIVCN